MFVHVWGVECGWTIELLTVKKLVNNEQSNDLLLQHTFLEIFWTFDAKATNENELRKGGGWDFFYNNTIQRPFQRNDMYVFVTITLYNALLTVTFRTLSKKCKLRNTPYRVTRLLYKLTKSVISI